MRRISAPIFIPVLLVFLLGSVPLWSFAQEDQLTTLRQAMYAHLEAGEYSNAVTRGLDLVSTAGNIHRPESPEVGDALESLADLYLRMSEYNLALKWYRKALAHRQANFGLNAPETGRTYAYIGKTLLQADEPDLALSYLQRSHTILAHSEPPQPELLLVPLQQLGDLHYQTAQYSQADSFYQRVIRIQERRYGLQSAPLARTLNNLAAVYLAQGKAQRAFAFYTHALNMQKAALGADHLETATTLVNLAVCHDQQGDFSQAEARLLEALAVREKHLPPTHQLISRTIDNLVTLYMSLGRYAEAEKALANIRDKWTKAYGPDHHFLALIKDKYAAYHLAREQPKLAVQYMEAALTLREQSLGLRHEQVAANLYNIGKLHNAMGRHPQARVALLRALDIFSTDRLGDEASITAILAELTLTDMAQGRMDQAEEHLLLMLDVKTSVFGDNHPEVEGVLEELLKFYRKIGNAEAAAETQTQLKTIALKRVH